MGSNTYEVRVHVGRDPVTRKVRQVSRTVHGSIKAARAERSRITTEAAGGEHEVKKWRDVTLGQLLDKWLTDGKPGRSPWTLDGYRRKIDHAIRPALGDVKLRDLTPETVDGWYRKLGRAGTSPATILHYHRILAAALHQGVKWGHLAGSPTDKATPPSAQRHQLTVPPPERVRMLIDLAAKSRAPEFAAVITFAALTGMRRGELCGLQWGDVDWATSIVMVRRAIWQTKGAWGTKDPKSHQVRRLVLGPDSLGVLAGRRRRVEELATTADIDPPGDGAYIFGPDFDWDRPLLPAAVTLAFSRLCRKAEAPALGRLRETKLEATRTDLLSAEQWGYRFHDLRHYTATELFRAGHHPRTVADRLGHRDPALTLRVYTHDVPELAARAAADIESTLAPPAVGQAGG